MNPLAVIGRVFLNFLASVGDLTLFAGRAIVHGVSGPYYPRTSSTESAPTGTWSSWTRWSAWPKKWKT